MTERQPERILPRKKRRGKPEEERKGCRVYVYFTEGDYDRLLLHCRNTDVSAFIRTLVLEALSEPDI